MAFSFTTSVQDILDSATTDVTNMVMNNRAISDYINRVQLDMLRYSRWKWLESEPVSFTATMGNENFFLIKGTAPVGSVDTLLALTDLDYIAENSIFDRTNNRPLFKVADKPLGTSFDQNAQPKLWKLSTAGVLSIYPPPEKDATIEFRYFAKRKQLTANTDILQVPDVYKDVFVAGVNELVARYAVKDNPRFENDVAYWRRSYEEGKREIVKDANLPPHIDFVKPYAN